MKDNYLWDRTGEPDAEVQQLEELLGSLRYQPQPLEIPATVNINRRRIFIPLAVAAAIALLVIGAGLWVRFARSDQPAVDQARRGSPSAVPQEIAPPKEMVAIASQPPDQPESPAVRRRVNQSLSTLKPRRTIQPVATALTEEELAQKEQVLIALRLVSAKLNFAQRKTQGLPQVNSIHNHKIG